MNYIVNKNTGVVTVCLMKDLVTAVDFTVTFTAQVKTPADALCKIIENKIIYIKIVITERTIMFQKSVSIIQTCPKEGF